jgi:hypothetical protein
MNGCLFRTVKARHHPASLLALFRRSDDSANSSSSTAAEAAQLQQLYDATTTASSEDVRVATSCCALLLHRDEHIANVREQVSLKLGYTTAAASGTTTTAISGATASNARRSLTAGGRTASVNELTTTGGDASITRTATSASPAVAAAASAGRGEYIGDARIRVLFCRTGLRSTAQGFEVVSVPSSPMHNTGNILKAYIFILLNTRLQVYTK